MNYGNKFLFPFLFRRSHTILDNYPEETQRFKQTLFKL